LLNSPSRSRVRGSAAGTQRRCCEQAELHLLILRSGVGLCGDFTKLHFELAEIVARRRQPVLQSAALDQREIRRVFRGFLLRTKIEHRLLRVLHALVQTAARGFFFVERRLLCSKIGAALVRLGAQRSDLGLECAEGGGELRVAVRAPRQGEVAQPVIDAAITHRLRGLAAEAADLT